MPISPREMPFMAHIKELTKRLTISLVVVLLLSGLFYEQHIFKFLMDILLHPIRDYLPEGGLTVLGPFEMLTFRFKIAVVGAIIASSPLLIYQFFAFLAPGLKPRERKWLFPTVTAAVLLFLGGVLFAYFVIMGPAFEWLSQQGAGQISSMAAAGPYFSGISMMLVGFGIGFELPLVVFYLIGFGITPYDSVRNGWRYAYVTIVVVAAIATPDWSPWTMGGLSLALIVLYEGSLLLARLVFREKIKQQREDKKMEDEFYGVEEKEEEVKVPASVQRLTRQQQRIKEAAAQRRAEKARQEAELKAKAKAEAEAQAAAKAAGSAQAAAPVAATVDEAPAVTPSKDN